MADTDIVRRRVITPEVILSYPHLFEPQAPPNTDSEPKYSAALVFPEGRGVDGESIKAMQQAALEVGQARFGDGFADGVRKGKFHWPFNSDEETVAEKGYARFGEGTIFVNANSKQRPGVVSIVPDPNTGKPMVIEDEEKVYPGVIARVSVTFYPFSVSGNKGVGVGLNNVQIVRDGERLDSRLDPTDEFEADPEAVADLSDLEEDATDEGDDLSDLMQ